MRAVFDFHELNKLGVVIRRVVTDSRKVLPGDVFLACRGEYLDGRNFIAQAITAGAAAVLWEQDDFSWNPEWQVPHLAVPGLRWLAGPIAAHVLGEPSRQMPVIGVTGTNGKTSITHWLAQALSALGRSTAVIGTVGNGFWGQLEATTHTTPDPVSVQQNLAAFRAQGAQCVAIEVSSHGLDQGRVNGTHFEVAVFTNLTRDHLDYHGDMESYGEAKAKLFAWPALKTAVINGDDEFGRTLLAQTRHAGVSSWSYGLQQGDIHCRELQINQDGINMLVATPAGEIRIGSQLLGEFNAYNLLAALGVLLSLDVPLADAAHALGKIEAAPGRLQTVSAIGQPLVVVDYAHTPDALEKVLSTLQAIKPAGGKLYCVFGCGGDRDPGKRPLMGKAAAWLADVSVVTSDNPRSEEPQAIIEQILAGMGKATHIEQDRATAIDWAISRASDNDIVLIAGKGHEEYQEVSGVKQPFSDASVARAALAKRGGQA
jgi:UDP-N-acetylmuramoyl-L-alanyl-D-glutamate--2,6-diaminopimelate ligase